jgi:hypothetical protein
MNQDLAKSLTELIDETLAELEDLRKSRFDAEEIDMGSDPNGEMKKEEDKKEDEEKEEDEKAEKAEDKEEDKKEDEKAEKAEDKEEDEEESEEDEMKKADEECAKAEKMYKECMAKRDQLAEKIKMKKGESKPAEMKKSTQENSEIESLKKTFEAKLAEIADTVKKLADQPAPARGVSYKDIQPLAKGISDAEPLSKTKVLNDLVTLKKSGKEVSTEDVLRAELGSQGDLQEIASKYSIK